MKPVHVLTVIIGTLSVSLKALPALAQQTEKSESSEVWIEVFISTKGCKPSTAKRHSVAEIAENPNFFRGKCVDVQGYLNGLSVYATQTATPSLAASYRLGLHGRPAKMKRIPTAPTRIRVFGVVGICKDQHQTSANPMGYCHTSVGPYLELVRTYPLK
jgi:hypothetical protein